MLILLYIHTTNIAMKSLLQMVCFCETSASSFLLQCAKKWVQKYTQATWALKMVKTHIWRSSIFAHLLQWMVVLHQLSSSCNGTQKPYYHLQSHTASKPPNYSSAYYNQGAKSLPSLSAHDTVRIQNGTSWATKGKVIEPLEYPPRSYTVETESGHRLRRNRRDLLSTKEEFTPS